MADDKTPSKNFAPYDRSPRSSWYADYIRHVVVDVKVSQIPLSRNFQLLLASTAWCSRLRTIEIIYPKMEIIYAVEG